MSKSQVKVIQYPTTGSEYMYLEYEGERGRSFVDAKQMLILKQILPELLGKKDVAVSIWSPYRAMIHKVALELQDGKLGNDALKNIDADADYIIDLGSSDVAEKAESYSILLLVEPAWEFFYSDDDDPTREKYLPPHGPKEKLFDAENVIIIVPDSFMLEPREPAEAEGVDRGSAASEDKAGIERRFTGVWPNRDTYGPTLEKLIDEHPVLETAFKEERASLEHAHLISIFDNYPDYKSFKRFLKGSELFDPDEKDCSFAEELGAELLAETFKKYEAWRLTRAVAEDDGPHGDHGCCAHRSLRLLRELPFRYLQDSEGANRLPSDSPDRDRRFDRRFDFTFVCNDCGRVLLAVEIDGGYHRQKTGMDKERNGIIKNGLRGMYLRGNERGYCEEVKSKFFDRTGFTVLHLLTNGESCFEVDGNEDFVSAFEVLRERLEHDGDPSAYSYVKMCTVRKLPIGVLGEGDAGRLVEQDAGEDDALSATAKNRILEKRGFIKRCGVGWKPVRNDGSYGIVQSLFGSGLSSSCLYLDDALEEILKKQNASQGA